MLFQLTPAGRKDAFDLIRRMVAKAPLHPPTRRAPSPDRRVKIQWSSDIVARFQAEVPRAKNDIDLAARLGLPAFCRGAMRAARSRYARGAARAGPASQPRG